MSDRLTPHVREILEGRNRAIKAVSHMDVIDAIHALQLAVASHISHSVRVNGLDEAGLVLGFLQTLRATLAAPAGLVVPVRATNPPPRC